MDCSPRLLCPWDSPAKNTEVGCHSLLQGIFPPQGSNPGLLHRMQILYRHQLRKRRRRWHPTPVLLPGKSHGWGSLVGCHLWGRTELDTTECLHFHCSLSRFGEGNGNPLQCSCLENPGDRGAWWASVSGVTQHWPRLKRRRSSSCKAAAAAAVYLKLRSLRPPTLFFF